eukprot:2857154-Alexandrium_andersonii.AAC.1
MEQPAISTMKHMPRMTALADQFNMLEICTWMGAFGAVTPAATRLYSNNGKAPTGVNTSTQSSTWQSIQSATV